MNIPTKSYLLIVQNEQVYNIAFLPILKEKNC